MNPLEANANAAGRSALMRAVRRENTAPELEVRKFLHAQGFRFRTHVRELPGTPDIVLPRRSAVVFVHGCFWHGHTCKHGRVASKTNAAFWASKIQANRIRDLAKIKALRALGWRVERVWECQCNSSKVLSGLATRLREIG